MRSLLALLTSLFPLSQLLAFACRELLTRVVAPLLAGGGTELAPGGIVRARMT